MEYLRLDDCPRLCLREQYFTFYIPEKSIGGMRSLTYIREVSVASSLNKLLLLRLTYADFTQFYVC